MRRRRDGRSSGGQRRSGSSAISAPRVTVVQAELSEHCSRLRASPNRGGGGTHAQWIPTDTGASWPNAASIYMTARTRILPTACRSSAYPSAIALIHKGKTVFVLAIGQGHQIQL